MRRGYTIIELLISLAITGLLISFGASAYKQAQIRQALNADIETITSLLQAAKKQAVIGEKDCAGPLVGIEITFIHDSSLISKRAVCQDDSGSPTTTTLSVAQPTTSASFSFRPLDGSTTLTQSGLGIVITTPYSLTSHFTITQAGAITHVIP